jgi:hypothetical protein
MLFTRPAPVKFDYVPAGELQRGDFVHVRSGEFTVGGVSVDDGIVKVWAAEFPWDSRPSVLPAGRLMTITARRK